MTKPNGYDRSATALHGHTLPVASREARGARLEPGGAASDDRRDFPAAAGAFAPAGMERDGCAEAAPSGGKKKGVGKNGKAHGANGHAAPALANSPPSRNAEELTHMAAHRHNSENAMVEIPPGIAPLAADGPGFVDDMHAHVDLYLACTRLVKSSDEKIAQRMVERLLEMSYGKSPSQCNEDATPAPFSPRQPAKD